MRVKKFNFAKISGGGHPRFNLQTDLKRGGSLGRTEEMSLSKEIFFQERSENGPKNEVLGSKMGVGGIKWCNLWEGEAI